MHFQMFVDDQVQQLKSPGHIQRLHFAQFLRLLAAVRECASKLKMGPFSMGRTGLFSPADAAFQPQEWDLVGQMLYLYKNSFGSPEVGQGQRMRYMEEGPGRQVESFHPHHPDST
jgi:hypothetical protein